MCKSGLSKLITTVVLLTLMTSVTSAQTRLKNICRVKGQEENTLQGIGLVVGLGGTGDSSSSVSTARALATAMQFMGSPVSLEEIADPKNVALVMIQATVPSAGARQGDLVDCVVNSIGDASSLADGTLIAAPLLGPRTTGDRVFAIASGKVTIPKPQTATAGKLIRGCRFEEDFRNAFHKDGKITLVLDKNKADFQLAQDVAYQLNLLLSVENNDVTEVRLARALDQLNIEVTIPNHYLDDPVSFVSDIMDLKISNPETGARVVINRAAGTVVVTGNTTIGSAVVAHKNITVETGLGASSDRLIGIEAPKREDAQLKALVNALEAVQVEPEDIADILLGLSRSGRLHAHVIVE